MACQLSVVVPTYGRSTKLRALLEGLGVSACDHSAFEVIVVVDGPDEAPLRHREVLPPDVRFVGLTKTHAGPAAARNLAVEHASGGWVLFFDDDARVDPETIGGHLRLTGRDPESNDAFLGRVDWPDELIDSPWRRLLAGSSMLFFWDRMTSGHAYGFRHFWTTNLSVRRDALRAVGGFREAFPTAIHEDIELGWRLEETFGTRVVVDTSVRCLHDHPLDPLDYFRREHKSGGSARAARDINRRFHDDIWGWIEAPQADLQTLERFFSRSGRETLELLVEWSVPSPREPSPGEMQAMYLAHLPLKRMFFLQGYLGRPFEALWDTVQTPAATPALAAQGA